MSHISQSFSVLAQTQLRFWYNKKRYQRAVPPQTSTKTNLSSSTALYSILRMLYFLTADVASYGEIENHRSSSYSSTQLFLKCHYHLDLGNLGNEPKQKTKRHQRTIKRSMWQTVQNTVVKYPQKMSYLINLT